MVNDNNIPISNNNGIFQKEKEESFNLVKEILYKKIPEAESLKQFYLLIQEMVYEINNIYENIACKSGCSRCCKFYGSPQLYSFEWNNIKKYISNNFDEKQIKRVKVKLEESITYLKELLENDVSENYETAVDIVIPVFYLSECPFLYKNMCSIYEARPLICRAFGNSALRRDETVPLTCMEEVERWKTETNNEFLLPYFDYLQQYIKKAVNEEDNEEFFSIQFWLTDFFDEY